MSRNAYNGLESYKRDPDNTSEILGQGTQDVDSNSPDANRYWIIRKAHDRFAPLWETDVFFENVGRKSLLPAPGSPKSGPNCREFIQAAYTAIGVAAQQYAESTNNINNSPNLQYMLFYSMMPVKLGNNDLLPIFTEWTNMSPIPSNTGSAKPSYWAQETTVQQVQDADPIDSICN
ncbi:hypothetical protein FRB99_006571 [Tulasnella sp. 403]|nr:hypothetical protein FRB99_006571 [Tulasnella sp. 403]